MFVWFLTILGTLMRKKIKVCRGANWRFNGTAATSTPASSRKGPSISSVSVVNHACGEPRVKEALVLLN
jgi:hypothetical protein